jgi:hypothetical protein
LEASVPINIKVIHSKDFIKTTITGVLDFTGSRQALLDSASHIQLAGEYEILLDTREAEIVLSVVDIFELGQVLAAHSSLRLSKLALLTSTRGVDQAQFLETVTENQGVRFRVFTDFEEAITWLVMQKA